MGGGKALVNAYYRSAQALGVRCATTRRCSGWNCEAAVSSPRTWPAASASRPAPACWPAAASSPTANGCARPGAQRARRVAGRPLPDPRHALQPGRAAEGPDRRRAPTRSATRRRRTWWPSTRARRCTTAASARASTACRWASWSTATAERFYDEGEDFWPKRYAIWGRLVALQPGAGRPFDHRRQGRGALHAAGVQGRAADTLPELARSSACPSSVRGDRARLQRRLPRRQLRPRGAGRLPHRGPEPPKTHWARPIDTPPFQGYTLRPGVTFTYLGLKVDAHGPRCTSASRPSPNLFAAGEMMAGNVLGQGYTAGVGMTIGTVFGRIAGAGGRRRQGGRHASRVTSRAGPAVDCARRGPWPRRPAAEGGRARVLQICNACRYCEGFCAVFPAMTRRLDFDVRDVHYLANLCHNCGACLHACQYAPPHEFAVNLPQAMARVRRQTYQAYAWPAALRRAVPRNGLVLALALAGAGAVPGAGRGGQGAGGTRRAGNFYAVFPHGLMVALFGRSSRFAVLALGVGVRASGARRRRGRRPRRRPAEATHDALRCVPGRRPWRGLPQRGRPLDAGAPARHHLTFYGFMLCLRGHQRGHALPLRVRLAGALRPGPACPSCWARWAGCRLLAGLAGLWLAAPAPPPAAWGPGAAARWTWASSRCCSWPAATGLALLAGPRARRPWRCCCACTWAVMAVMALFATLPYGKFAHGVYRWRRC
jgi:citrate/tricarballylate utilization protein